MGLKVDSRQGLFLNHPLFQSGSDFLRLSYIEISFKQSASDALRQFLHFGFVEFAFALQSPNRAEDTCLQPL